MTQDEIIEMARQAGLGPIIGNVTLGEVQSEVCLEAFAKLVEERTAAKERDRIIAANELVIEHVNEHIKHLEYAVQAEREACAAICDEETNQQSIGGNSWWATTNCAEAIRARSGDQK